MKKGVKILLLLAILLAAAGCGQQAISSPGTQPTAAAPLPVVAVVKPERKTVRRVIAQPGQIEAFQQTPLYARIAGYVQEVKADIGDQVKKGQPLAVLSVPEMDEELLQKKAIVTQAKAEIELAQRLQEADRKSTRLNSSHIQKSRMPSSA